MIKLNVNGQEHTLDVAPDTPLLWVIRENLAMAGTKFGCGIAQCGACTVHLDGNPIRSCITPVSAAIDKAITTIEGLAYEGLAYEGLAYEGLAGQRRLHPVQAAWIAEQVPQCGYCQSGQIMSAVALLERSPSPTDEEINQAMSGNICRCGMYSRIRKAIKSVANSPVQMFDPQQGEEVQNG